MPNRRLPAAAAFFAAALTAFAVLLWGLQVTSGAAYYAKGDYSSAVGSLRRLVNGKYATHEDSVYLAISLIMSGNREAGHALKSRLDASGASSPQKLELDILCSEAGNTSAADMYKQLIHAVDSISIERLKANASISETEYLETKNMLTEESLRSSRLATALFAVAAVLILCIFVSVIIIVRIRNAREKESFRYTILELRESLRQIQESTPERNDGKTESSSSPDVLRKLLSRQYEEIETLLIKAEKATQPHQLMKFLEELHQLMRLNDSAVSDLEKAFEREYPGILVRFREAEPEADSTTCLIFVMSGLGIKTAIQRIMLGAATDGAVYSRRKRLLRRGPARRRGRTLPLRQRLPACQTADRGRRHAGPPGARRHPQRLIWNQKKAAKATPAPLAEAS